MSNKKNTMVTVNTDNEKIDLHDDNREIRTFNKQNLPWSAWSLSKKMDKGEAVFDAAVQRTLVWKVEQKSLLIHSMLIGAPVPPMYAVKSESENGKKIYSFLDGKQRSNAVHDFINNVYALKGIPTITFEDGSEADINGLTFDDLSDNMQDSIRNFNFVIYVFDDISEDEQADIFYRLNNGKALSAIEISRVKAVSLPQFQKLATHDLFTKSLSEKQIAKYGAEDIAIKSHIMAYGPKKSLDTKDVRPYVESVDVTNNQIEELNSVFDFVNEIYNSVYDPNNKVAKRTAKRLVTRTHLLSFIPLYLKAVRGEEDKNTVADFVKYFFGTTKLCISQQYADYSHSGSGHEENVKRRLDAINEEYTKFLTDNKKEVPAKKTEEKTEAKAEPEKETENQNQQTTSNSENENQFSDSVLYYVQGKNEEAVVSADNGYYTVLHEEDFPSYWNVFSPSSRLKDTASLNNLAWQDISESEAQSLIENEICEYKG